MEPTYNRRPSYRTPSFSYKMSGAANTHAHRRSQTNNKSSPTPLIIPSTTSSSSSSTPIPKPSRSKRHKPTYVHPPLTDEQCVTLTTRMDIIVKRCYPQPPPPESSTPLKSPSPTGKKSSRASSSKGKAKSIIPAWPEFHPYSRRYDLDNDRSYNPSPRQIEKAAKAAEKTRLEGQVFNGMKKEIVAPPMVKSRSRSSNKEKNTGAGLKRTSPRTTQLPLLPSPELPSVASSSPIISAFTIPKPPTSLNGLPRPLKRTRSVGLGISMVGTSSGLNEPSVASPLRRVTGPADQDGDSISPAMKREREDEADQPAKRAKTTSPTSVIIRLNRPAQESKSIQGATEPTSTEKPGQTGRGLGLANGDLGSTQMRRVASASAAVETDKPKPRRQSSSESTSLSTRSRREVAIPERFRDFELGGVAV